MLQASQKCQYALRAIFELAKRRGNGPTTVQEIADVQAIPPRFLELILGQLRRGGFVTSRRGIQGGYELAADPYVLTAGEIIRYIDGSVAPVRCVAKQSGEDCPLYGSCAFFGMWQQARQAVEEVYDGTTFEDLLAAEPAEQYVSNYSI